VFQTWTFRMIEPTLRAPEYSILGLGVEYYTIKVEECGF
jgi:hypothetical protein